MIPFAVIFLLIGVGLVYAGRGLEKNGVRARG